ncbi:hypothetical protein [Geothrix oryzae]|uniref:hypothetical protein n=1 Tax=Geothrix oryzae TaxID=2927975 RepID=UPI00257363E9|nr:hypothetical protein [Geothrix oryzae]
MSRETREKLSDIINKTEYVFAQKASSFDQAYPSISKLRIDIIEKDFGHAEPISHRVYTETSFRHAVNCSASICYGGGVELGWILHDMVAGRVTDWSDTKRCEGYEGSPKGKKKYRSCLHMFEIKIHVDFKEPVDAGSEPA